MRPPSSFGGSACRQLEQPTGDEVAVIFAVESMKLSRRYVEKPWGRTQLPRGFTRAADQRIGEIWFQTDEDLPLLAKYLFTSETLSVQVHPNDEQARLRGAIRGKAECWFVVEAEPDASIGIGLKHPMSSDELRAAAIDGSIEQAIEWRPVAAGDFLYVPPGTIHAIGGGLSLIEFQQNADVTYRLYDYGRPRELHLDEAVSVANAAPYPRDLHRSVPADADCVLVDGPYFTLVHAHSDRLADRRRWVLPLSGSVTAGGASAEPGECLLVDASDRAEIDGRALIGAIAKA